MFKLPTMYVLKQNVYHWQGFFQPFWDGALWPFALGIFPYFYRNWENFFNHFYMIFFINKDPKTALNHSYSWLYALVAHLSRRLIGELIVYQWSDVRPSWSVVVVRSQCSNIIFSETAWPIKAKFYVEPPWVGGTIFCSRHLDHMTKMASTPIYGQNPSKIFFSRAGGPIFTKLGM